MKKSLVLLSVFVCCVLISTLTFAANPDKIKVGILLPLTGTFAAASHAKTTPSVPDHE